jgi:hypothetical protein
MPRIRAILKELSMASYQPSAISIMVHARTADQASPLPAAG